MTAEQAHLRYQQLHADGVITARELDILSARLTLSQYTVARGMHISRSTVRSIERNALEKIARHETREDAA